MANMNPGDFFFARSLTASVIPFKESPDTPYILLTPDAISESTITSATLFAKITNSLSLMLMMVPRN